MPVKNLSDQLRLPRLGKIRLGEKRIHEKTGKEYPASLDYFVVPEEVAEIYGPKPRKLDVMLPMEDRDSFFAQWFKRYGSSKGLICKGDGEQATEINEKTDEMTESECPGKACEFYQDGACKTIGNLQVVLHKVPGLGIYQIDTGSYNSILNINSGIEMIRGMLGRISWVPLVLKVEMCEAHPKVNGARIKTIVPVMTLTADVSVEEILQMVKRPILDKLPKQVEIDNPDVDEKEDLLYPKKDGTLEPEKKEEMHSHEDRIKAGNKVIEKELTSEKPAKEEPIKEEGKLFSDQEEKSTNPKDNMAINRNRLNIVFHKLKKRLMSAGIWDDEKYRAWLNVQFGVKSSKDLDGKQMIQGIEIMGQLWNDQLDKEK